MNLRCVTTWFALFAFVLLFGCGTTDSGKVNDSHSDRIARNDRGSETVAKKGVPEWVSSEGNSKQFPRSEYFQGYGDCSVSRDMSKDDAVEYSKKMALKQMLTGMRVTVSAEDTSVQFSRMTNGREELVDAFRSSVVAKSDFTFDGIEFKSYVRKKNVYALALLNKKKAVRRYQRLLDETLVALEQLHNKAIRQALAGNTTSTKKTYAQCEKKINTAYGIIQQMHLLGYYDTLDRKSISLIADVQSTLSDLWSRKCNSIDEAVNQLVHSLGEQADPKGQVHVLAPMIEDSYQYSQFSGRFRSALELQLSRDSKIHVVIAGEAMYMPSTSRKENDFSKSSNLDYKLRGSYFVNEDKGQIKMVLSLVNLRNNTIDASASAILSKRAADGLELYPQNYMEMARDRRVFGAGELVGGGLNLEVWTSLGTDGLLLESGEDLDIFVRVNKPCYIRFIYHLNNGARVFVGDSYKNYYIGEDKVNRPVQLPDSFTILPPFGSETMQFFASTERFPDLKEEYRTYGGESYKVVSGGLDGINRKHRGIGIKKSSEKSLPVVEERINLTTIRR